MASANCCGRSLPIYWITVPKEDLANNLTETERKLLRALHRMIPAQTQVVLLADRGFAKEEVIRISGRGQDHLPGLPSLDRHGVLDLYQAAHAAG